MERKLEESMEQLKNLNIQHMALMRRKKAAEEEANANKAKAQVLFLFVITLYAVLIGCPWLRSK